MSYVATAVVRGESGWSAAELDLSGAADVEEVADRLRDVDPDAEVSLLLVESDDAYLVVLRLDQGEDLRIFGSDAAFAEESRLGALLLGEAETSASEIEDALAAAEGEQPTQPGPEPEADPVGEADLLADLGVSAHRLLTICAKDGMLPADIIAELAELIGFSDQIEELRVA